MRNAGANLKAFGVGTSSVLTDLQVIDQSASIFTNTDELLGVFSGGIHSNVISFTEPGLQGWQIYVDLNDNARYDDGEPTDVTDFNGNYTIPSLADGTYIVREVPQYGWRQVFPGGADKSHVVTIDGADVSGVNFGNLRRNTDELFIVDSEGALGSVDLLSGDVTRIGGLTVQLEDIAIGQSGEFYGVSTTDLYRVDPNNGNLTHIGPLQIHNASSLDFGPDNKLYVVGEASLYTVDTATGLTTFVGNVGENAVGDIAFAGNDFFVSAVDSKLIAGDIDTLSTTTLSPITTGNVHALDYSSAFGLVAVFGTRILAVDELSGESFFGRDYVGNGLGTARGAAFGSPQAVPPPVLLGTIQGIVWNDNNENRQRDIGEHGFNGVEVFLDTNDNGRRDIGEQSTFTNVNGQYQFTNLPLGDYIVRQTLGPGNIQTYPRAFLGTAYLTTPQSSQTRLFEINPENGEVNLFGTQGTSVRMHGVARTNDGRIYGTNFHQDAFYSIDRTTGTETLIGFPGFNLTGALTYISATDTLYTIASDPAESGHRLATVDRNSGAFTPVGDLITGMDAVSSITYDWVNNVFIVFDNFDDEFYEVGLNGGGHKISDATDPIHNWSLAFDGNSFYMADVNDPGRIATVNPYTGLWQDSFTADTPVRLESLDFLREANVAHRVTVIDDVPLTDIDFGRKGPSRELIVSETGDTSVTEAGSTDTFLVRLASAPSSNVVVDIFVSDSTEVSAVTTSVTLTPANWNVGEIVTIAGVDDSDVDGDIISSVRVQVNNALSDDNFDGLLETVTAVTLDDDVPQTNTHIEGFVWRDENRNGIQDNGEEPLAGAQLYLDANVNGRRDPGEVFLPSRDDGTFAFNNIAPGQYVVRQILSGPTFQSSPSTFVGIKDVATLYFFDPETREVRSASSAVSTTIASVIMTRNGRVYGTSTATNSLYQLDPDTGQNTLIGAWGTPQIEGLIYDPAIDRLYAIGTPDSSSTLRQLYDVERGSAGLSAVGGGLAGVSEVSGVTFDTRARRVVIFDNSTDTFFEMGLDGNGQALATTDAATDSTSLSFDGEQFLLQLRNPPDDRQFISADPDTGVTANSIRSLVPVPSPALDYVPYADVAHRVSVALNETADGLRFGQFNIGAGFTVSETGSGTVVKESGSSDTMHVTLNRRPDFPVVIDVFANDPTEADVTGPSRQLTFTPEDWNIEQEVTVFGLNEEDPDGNQTSQVVFRINFDLTDDAFDQLPEQFVDVVTIDDDTPGFTLSRDSLIVSEAGGEEQFSIVLNAEPNSNVAIDLSVGTPSEVSALPQALTFTRFNWDVPQLITVTGVDDISVDGHQNSILTVSIRHNASDDDFDPLPDQIVNVTTLDDDTIGLYVDRTDLTVLESARPDHFNVVLTAAPTSNVVVNVAPSNPDEIRTNVSTLVFNPSNWSSPQQVTVSGLRDEVLDGSDVSTIVVSVDPSQSADAYDNVPARVVNVTNQDTNFAALAASNSLLHVSEDGDSDTFSVRLTAAPLSPVVFNLNSSDPGEAIATPQQVVFDPDNWDVPQLITVTGVDDAPIDGVQEVTITVSVIAALSDDAFDHAPDTSVRVLNKDNDIAGITLSKTTATVNESGTTDTFTVVLNTVPSSDVVLTIGRQSHGEVVESPFRLTFNVNNWDVPQEVTLRGIDDALDDGDQVTEIRVAIDPLVTDDDYDEVPLQSVFVTTIDNDDGEVVPTVTGPVERQSAHELVTLTWQSVPAANSYEVWLELIGGENNPVINPTISRTNYTLTETLPIGRYRTWVKAFLPNNQETGWARETFEVSAKPVISDLPFHATDPTPQITWSAIPGATSYRVYVNNKTTRHSAAINEFVTVPSFTPSENLPFGHHQIWVQAYGTANYAAEWSTVADYYVGPELLSPTRPTFDNRPQFSWSHLDGVATYHLVVKRGSEVVINQSGITQTTFLPPVPLDSGEYRWWIKPTTIDGRDGAWSKRGTFNVNGRPQVQSAVPSNDGTVTITSQVVDGAESYEVYLLNTNTGGLIQRISGLMSSTVETHPVVSGDYRVWFRSRHSNGFNSHWSRPLDFVVDNANISLRATPTSPTAPTFDLRPTFTWTADFGAASYDLYLTDGTTVIQQNGLTSTSWTPNEDLSATTWQWWVRARTSNGVGPWSPVAETSLSGRARVLSPIGTTSNRTPTVTWTPVAGAERYIFQLDNLTTGQTSVIRENHLANPNFTPIISLPPGEYRAWVQAINGNNVAAPWSLAFDFTITGVQTPENSSSDEFDLAEQLSPLKFSPLETYVSTDAPNDRPGSKRFSLAIPKTADHEVVEDSTPVVDSTSDETVQQRQSVQDTARADGTPAFAVDDLTSIDLLMAEVTFEVSGD